MDTESNEFPTLSNAPIREAILDVRTARSEFFDGDADSLREKVASSFPDYPLTEERFEGEMHFNVAAKDGSIVATKRDPSLIAFVLRNEEQTEAVQLRRDGFSFSRLKPYESWDRFVHGFWTCREKCESYFPLNPVSRIGLRYINVLPLPAGQFNLASFLRFRPEYGDELGASIGVLLKATFQETNDLGEAITSNVILRSGRSSAESSSFILDIDVFCIPRQKLLEECADRVFPALRRVKNTIFKSALTPDYYDTFK